jgi:hypothetical protein
MSNFLDDEGAGIGGLFDADDFPPFLPDGYVTVTAPEGEMDDETGSLLLATSSDVADEDFYLIPKDRDEETGSYDGLPNEFVAALEAVTLAPSGAYMFQEMDLALVAPFLEGAPDPESARERAVSLMKAASSWIFGDLIERLGTGGVATEVAFQLYPDLRRKVPLYTYGDILANDPLVRIGERGYCLREDLATAFESSLGRVISTRDGNTAVRYLDRYPFGKTQKGYREIIAPTPKLFLWVAASSGYILDWPGGGDVKLTLAENSNWLLGYLQYYGLPLLAIISEVMRWPNQIMFMVYCRHFLTYMVDAERNSVGGDAARRPQAPWDLDVFHVADDPRAAAARTGYPSIVALVEAIYYEDSEA